MASRGRSMSAAFGPPPEEGHGVLFRFGACSRGCKHDPPTQATRRPHGKGSRGLFRGPQEASQVAQLRRHHVGKLVVTAASDPPRIIATDKETGQVGWESSFADTPEVELSSAP